MEWWEAKEIMADGVFIGCGYFKNDGSMVEKLPADLKSRILQYMKEPEPILVGDDRMVDPVTGKWYGSTNLIRMKDGFIWSTPAIYMLEHYDVKLSEEFLKLFTS